MSFRGTQGDMFQLVRDMQTDIEELKRKTGEVRQNTIRLGNWVLEAEADELVRMTNLVTGVVSYVGANDDVTIEGGGAYIEVPPFSFGGVIRNAFESVKMRSNVYVMPTDFHVGAIGSTLANVSASGPTFQLYVNDIVVYTSDVLSTANTIVDTDIDLIFDDTLYVEISNDGDGFSAGLNVMLRLSATPPS